MSHWNHRVIRHKGVDGSEYLAVHEVHYNKQGKPVAYAEGPAAPLSETKAGLRWSLDSMARALRRPILNAADFGSGA